MANNKRVRQPGPGEFARHGVIGDEQRRLRNLGLRRGELHDAEAGIQGHTVERTGQRSGEKTS